MCEDKSEHPQAESQAGSLGGTGLRRERQSGRYRLQRRAARCSQRNAASERKGNRFGMAQDGENDDADGHSHGARAFGELCQGKQQRDDAP